MDDSTVKKLQGYEGKLGSVPRKQYIEAVTVCVDYSDFLAYSILFNKQCFDRWVIVTTPPDEATRRLCEYHNLEYLVTSTFYGQDQRGGRGKIYRPPFNKGSAINAGLQVLDRTGWVIHLDADIVLPPRARDMLEIAELDPGSIYGVDRLMNKHFDEWAVHVTYPEIQHDMNIFVRSNTFPFNVRVAKHREPPPKGGYLPIGYFQMWNPSASNVHDYPIMHTTSGRSDMIHADKWPRAKRGVIPEITAIHLESEEVRMAANWEGRRTAYFGPKGISRNQAQYVKEEWL